MSNTRLSIIENRLLRARKECRVQEVRLQWLKEENLEWKANPGFSLIDNWMEITHQKLSLIENRLSMSNGGLQDQNNQTVLIESCFANIKELTTIMTHALNVLERQARNRISD